MAEVSQRAWRIPGQKTKRLAWGYTAVVNGKRTRAYRSEWSKEDAEKALAAVQLQIEQPQAEPQQIMTFAQAVELYKQTKARKRTLHSDSVYLEDFKAAFGADTPLTQITNAKISAWRAARNVAVSPKTGRPYTAAAINRPLTTLRCLLRLALDEWQILSSIPKIRREREPQGRIRFLTEDEIVRLLDACQKSKNPELRPAVILALHTGLRRGEVFGLTWDRVELSHNVIRLELTKSGKRRVVPLNDESYAALVALQPKESGRVFRSHKIRTAFENALVTAKVEDFRWHDLRHTFASWLVMKGFSIVAVQQLLGHANITMTMKYAHLAPGHLSAAVAGLSGLTQTARVHQTSDANRTQEPVNGALLLSKSA
jgi:integrase